MVTRNIYVHILESILDLCTFSAMWFCFAACCRHTVNLPLFILFLSCAAKVEALRKVMGESPWVWTSIGPWGSLREVTGDKASEMRAQTGAKCSWTLLCSPAQPHSTQHRSTYVSSSNFNQQLFFLSNHFHTSPLAPIASLRLGISL